MSILVFFCVVPAPFLVHESSSCTVHPSLVVSFFHLLYVGSFMSVLISMYMTFGMLYCVFMELRYSSAFSHFFFVFPLSACIPPISHLDLFGLIIILVIIFGLLYRSLVGMWLRYLFISIAVPFPLCWYWPFSTSFIGFDFPAIRSSFGIRILLCLFIPVSSRITASYLSRVFFASFSLCQLFLLLGNPLALRHVIVNRFSSDPPLSLGLTLMFCYPVSFMSVIYRSSM